jgi:hypothetical protein
MSSHLLVGACCHGGARTPFGTPPALIGGMREKEWNGLPRRGEDPRCRRSTPLRAPRPPLPSPPRPPRHPRMLSYAPSFSLPFPGGETHRGGEYRARSGGAHAAGFTGTVYPPSGATLSPLFLIPLRGRGLLPVDLRVAGRREREGQ